MIFLLLPMKNNSFAKEISASLILLLLLGLFVEPFGYMPPMAVMPLALVIIIVFVALAGFVWYEQAADEREAWHSNVAGRFAFLAGIAVLLVGIIKQTLEHQKLDIWLLVTLCVMVIVKLAGHIYSQVKH